MIDALEDHKGKASTAHGIDISAERTKLTTNDTIGMNKDIKVDE